MTYYDDIAAGYNELYGEEQIAKLGIIANHLNVVPEDSLLDVGCGTGISTEFWNCDAVGIDPSEELLDVNADQKTCRYLHGSAEHLPFPDHSFDIVISVSAIHNFDDVEKGLSEIKRVGKGKFALTVLKKAKQFEKIERLILDLFSPDETIEEEKDMIYCKTI